MLNSARLVVFQEVIGHGSFSAAADALSYSQSAVSQAIATLEGELGVALIERNRGGVRPTAAGASRAVPDAPSVRRPTPQRSVRPWSPGSPVR